jgi:integrase
MKGEPKESQMSRTPFTDLTIRSLKEGIHFDAKTPAFGIRIGKRTKTWFVIKTKGRIRTVVGHYPDLNLQAARAAAKRLMLDPVAQPAPTLTFSEVRRRYLLQHPGRASTKKELTRILTNRFAKFDSADIATLTDQDIAAQIDGIAPSEALHSFRAIRALFRWAARPPRRYVAHSPLGGYQPPPAGKSRDRVLTPAELKAVWHACPANPFGYTVRLLILTGCRKGEVQHLTLDGNLAYLAAAHSKNGRAHLFPVPPEAQNYLSKPLKWGGWSKSKVQLDTASRVANHWQIHDLRRSYATVLASLQVPPFVIEALLNHKSGQISGVAAVYNRYSYLKEMREAVQKYEAWFAENVLN